MAQMHTLSAHALVKSSLSLAPTNATQNGDGVDTLGYRRAMLVIAAVTGNTTTVQVGIQESDDNSTFGATITGSTNPAVAQAANLPASGNAGVVYLTEIDLSKRKRYLRAVLIGTSTNGAVAASFVLFNAWNAAPAQDKTTLSI